MAALRKMDQAIRGVDKQAATPTPSTKIYDFVQQVYAKKGGAGDELKRVHSAYLANQKLRDKPVG